MFSPPQYCTLFCIILRYVSPILSSIWFYCSPVDAQKTFLIGHARKRWTRPEDKDAQVTGEKVRKT